MGALVFSVLMILLTVGVFIVMGFVYSRLPTPIFTPILTSTLIIVVVLLLSNISYESYMIGGKWIDYFLGPAVVALAFPLYKQRDVLVKYFIPIISGVIVGLVAALGSGFLFAKVIGLDRPLILSMIPKSLTTPVAIQVSNAIGGISAITVILVMIAGFTGVLLGPLILKVARIKSSLGSGIALGSGSHALGTSKAFEFGEVAASMSSVAMTLSAIFGSLMGPLFVWVFQI